MVCEDRISAMPEDLLVTILSLVPTKDVVATMILSKRWLSIWTKNLTLEYIDSDVDDESDDDGGDEDEDEDGDGDEHENEQEGAERKKSVWWFLDKSMQLHKAEVVDRLCIELGRQCPTNADVGKWVAEAVSRCVINLTFKLRWSADPTCLPNSLYSCRSLVMLTLSHKILVEVPSSASLPSLEWLELFYVVYKENDSLVRFLSSCPVLEKLTVVRQNDDNLTKFCVKVPSLLYLSYESYNGKDVGETSRCLVIDTPRLKELCLTMYTSEDYWLIEDMPRLDCAYISVDTYLDDKFLRSLSLVMDLHIFISDESLVRCCTIKFSRLVRLRISPYKLDWLGPLMLLLGNSQKLKELLFDYYEYTDEPEDLPLSWNQPSSVPGCLSSQFEIFEWNEYGARE